jgi:hypothetical protein
VSASHPATACSGDATDTARDEDEAAAVADEADELPAGYADHQSDVYADDAHWLCKPGIAADVCGRDLDATVVLADGTTQGTAPSGRRSAGRLLLPLPHDQLRPGTQQRLHPGRGRGDLDRLQPGRPPHEHLPGLRAHLPPSDGDGDWWRQ